MEERIDRAPRKTLAERMDEDSGGWNFPQGLFGNAADINDFEFDAYRYFLDNVESLSDLIEGLAHLSPFADDALDVAEKMSLKDFVRFKKALARMREQVAKDRQAPPKFPRRYETLVVPAKFLEASFLASRFQAPLGVAMIRIAEEKANGNI